MKDSAWHRIQPGKAIAAFAAALIALLLQSIAPSARAGIPEPDLVWYGKVLMTSGAVAVRATAGTLT